MYCSPIKKFATLLDPPLVSALIDNSLDAEASLKQFEDYYYNKNYLPKDKNDNFNRLFTIYEESKIKFLSALKVNTVLKQKLASNQYK